MGRPNRREGHGGKLIRQLAPRTGRDLCLGPNHEPAVEGWLSD